MVTVLSPDFLRHFLAGSRLHYDFADAVLGQMEMLHKLTYTGPIAV